MIRRLRISLPLLALLVCSQTMLAACGLRCALGLAHGAFHAGMSMGMGSAAPPHCGALALTRGDHLQSPCAHPCATPEQVATVAAPQASSLGDAHFAAPIPSLLATPGLQPALLRALPRRAPPPGPTPDRGLNPASPLPLRL